MRLQVWLSLITLLGVGVVIGCQTGGKSSEALILLAGLVNH